jgi:hypothetical protein
MKILLTIAILANWVQPIQSNFQENVKPLNKFHWFLIWKEPFGFHGEKDHSLIIGIDWGVCDTPKNMGHIECMQNYTHASNL